MLPRKDYDKAAKTKNGFPTPTPNHFNRAVGSREARKSRDVQNEASADI
jgi:hypothetical protein